MALEGRRRRHPGLRRRRRQPGHAAGLDVRRHPHACASPTAPTRCTAAPSPSGSCASTSTGERSEPVPGRRAPASRRRCGAGAPPRRVARAAVRRTSVTDQVPERRRPSTRPSHRPGGVVPPADVTGRRASRLPLDPRRSSASLRRASSPSSRCSRDDGDGTGTFEGEVTDEEPTAATTSSVDGGSVLVVRGRRRHRTSTRVVELDRRPARTADRRRSTLVRGHRRRRPSSSARDVGFDGDEERIFLAVPVRRRRDRRGVGLRGQRGRVRDRHRRGRPRRRPRRGRRRRGAARRRRRRPTRSPDASAPSAETLLADG